MANLEDLKRRKNLLSVELLQLRHEIDVLELEKSLPQLKAKYEGKYFKVKNLSSSDDSWWLYTFCRKVINQQEGVCDSFEIKDSYKKEVGFTYNEEEYLDFRCAIEIPKEEYFQALEKVQKQLNKLKKISDEKK